jgi:mRNA interferase MazF
VVAQRHRANQRYRLGYLFAGDTKHLPLLRIPLQPNATNGLSAPSDIMVDKITTVNRSKLGQRIGKISTTELLRVERGLLVFLGMAG